MGMCGRTIAEQLSLGFLAGARIQHRYLGRAWGLESPPPNNNKKENNRHTHTYRAHPRKSVESHHRLYVCACVCVCVSCVCLHSVYVRGCT
jgi:hypothetical protein